MLPESNKTDRTYWTYAGVSTFFKRKGSVSSPVPGGGWEGEIAQSGIIPGNPSLTLPETGREFLRTLS